MTAPIDPADGAALHEVREDWRAGRSLGRVYRTPTGSLEARLTRDGARLRRIYGPVTAETTVGWDELSDLARAFERWIEVRDDWAAYYERGLPPSSCSAQVYWAPGRAAEHRTSICSRRSAGDHSGILFTGSDELRSVATPRQAAPGIEVIADVWRTEPSVGPREGELVGQVWRIDERHTLDVRRLDARVHHGEDRFPWLAWESDVPAELIALRPTG